jgi:chitin disaccharide deacetylase
VIRLVLHADDVGMCHSANVAFVELSGAGVISAGSVMVPCPWSSEALEAAAADRSLDLGVHLTLNAEHRHYRWRPVANHPVSAGLTDDDGYMWSTVSEVRKNAAPDAVETEWRAQIDRALAAGVDVTHLDAHMGSALAPEWAERYVGVGIDYGIPVLLTGRLVDYGPHGHLGDAGDDHVVPVAELARSAGMQVFARVLETDFARERHRVPEYPTQIADGLAGIDDAVVYAALHPCRPGGEIEHIEPDHHHVRTDEYEVFSDRAWRAWLDAQPFEVVSMRTLRDEWRDRSKTLPG